MSFLTPPDCRLKMNRAEMAGMQNHTRSTSEGRESSGSVDGNPAATACSAGDRLAAASPEVAESLINGDREHPCCPGEGFLSFYMRPLWRI